MGVGNLIVSCEWVAITAFLVWLSYAILFKDRRSGRPSPDPAPAAPAAPPDPTNRVVQAVLGAALYVAVLGVPLVLLVAFAPLVACAAREGVSAQDLYLARWLPETDRPLRQLPQYLDRLDSAGDDPAAAAWVEVRRYVTGEVMATRREGSDLTGPIDPDRHLEVWAAFVAWGRDLAEPGASEAAAARAALARLAGRDDLHERVARYRARVAALPAARPVPADPVADYLTWAALLHVFYPNDDVMYLLQLQLHTRAVGFGGSLAQAILYALTIMPAFAALLVVAFGLVVNRGMKLVTVSFLGWALRVRDAPAYREFAAEAFSPGRFLACLAPAVVVAGATSVYFMEPFYALLWPGGHAGQYLLAGLWNVLVGGVLVESLGNVVTVALVRAGYRPMRMWTDNAFVGVASAGLLRLFQNSWPTIAAGLAVGLLQSALQKLAARGKGRATGGA